MGSVSQQMIDGSCCSECADIFVKKERDKDTGKFSLISVSHGYPVVCKSCYDSEHQDAKVVRAEYFTASETVEYIERKNEKISDATLENLLLISEKVLGSTKEDQEFKFKKIKSGYLTCKIEKNNGDYSRGKVVSKALVTHKGSVFVNNKLALKVNNLEK